MLPHAAKKKKNPWLSGLALVLVLAAGTALALANPALRSGPERPPGLAGLPDGRWTRSYERSFEQGLALRQPDLKPVAGQEAVFSISDPKGNVVFRRRDVTSVTITPLANISRMSTPTASWRCIR